MSGIATAAGPVRFQRLGELRLDSLLPRIEGDAGYQNLLGQLASTSNARPLRFSVLDAAKPALQSGAEKDSAKAGPSNEPGPVALPVPLTAPTEPTKPTGGKPQLRRIK